jgi:hypothetical protein
MGFFCPGDSIPLWVIWGMDVLIKLNEHVGSTDANRK